VSISSGRKQSGPTAKKPKVQPIAQAVDPLKTGLPANLDAERFILGSILMDDSRLPDAAALEPDDFSLERHRLTFHRMRDLEARGEPIDRVTLAEELARHNELAHDGLSFLCSLDEGLPHVAHVDAYVRIVRDKSTLRRIAFIGQKLMNMCLLQDGTPNEILADHEVDIQELSQSRSRASQTIADIPAEHTRLSTFATPSYPHAGIVLGW
jgi:replicative DNA helicase